MEGSFSMKKITLFIILFITLKTFANPFADKNSVQIKLSYLPSLNFETKTIDFEISNIIGKKWGYKWKHTFYFDYRNTGNTDYFPVDLYKIKYTVSGETEKKWLKFYLNSYTDVPFYSKDTLNLGFNGGWTFWEKGKHSLIFGLFYESISSFLGGFPLPVVYYKYKSKNIYLLFPFVLHYQINKKNSFLITYFPVRNLKVSYIYHPLRPLILSFEGKIKLYTYYLAHRDNKDELLFYEMKTVGIRPTFYLNHSFGITGFIGYSFNGKYYKGEQYDQFLNLKKIKDSIFINFGGMYYF